MLREPRLVVVASIAALLLGLPSRAYGQASPLVPLDDPLRPLFEHLIDRGVVRDPSPFVRPFRQADAVAALRNARTDRDSAVIGRLLTAWMPAESAGWWSLAARTGAEAFTSPRRDLLRPEGPSGVRVLGMLDAHAVLGPVVLATRPTIAQRIAIDPDWPGNRVSASATCCRWHFPEAYLEFQQGFFRMHLGQIGRNWGPVGVDGIAMSDVGYARDDIAFEVKSRDLHVMSMVGFLRDTVRADGTPTRRYHVASRIGLRLGERWQVAAWQTAILEGPSRDVEGPFRNPLVLLPLVNQYGLGDRDNNVMVGAQVAWRSSNGIGIQAELALDDFIQREREAFPDRWAMTLRANGPGPAGTSWRAWYTRASALAFRATDPMESFTERGIGLGRGWADGDRIAVRLARPVGGAWLAAIELTGFRQGESRLDQPIDLPSALEKFPTGMIERTLRAAASISGRSGPVEIVADIGVNNIANQHHQRGVNATNVEARVATLLRLGTRGPLR